MRTAGYIGLDEVMRFADDIPASFHDWVFGGRIRPAFFIKKADGEEDQMSGRCCACGTEGIVPRKAFKHKEKCRCPFCGEAVEALHVSRYGTDTPDRGEKVSLVERLDEAGTMFLMRYFHAYENLRLSDLSVTKSGIYELGRDLITFGDGDVRYVRYECCGGVWKPSVDNGERIRWSPLQTVSGLERYGYGTHTSPESIDEAFEGDSWSGCRMSECAEDPGMSSDFLFEEMPEAFYRYPVTAELVRNGLAFLATGLTYAELEEVNVKRRTGEPLWKALGLRNALDLRNIERVHSKKAYRIYLELQEKRIPVTGNDLAWIEDICLKDRTYGTEAALNFLTRNTGNVHGLIRYMRKECGLKKDPLENTAAARSKAKKFIGAWNGYIDGGAGEMFPRNLMDIVKAGKKETKIPA